MTEPNGEDLLARLLTEHWQAILDALDETGRRDLMLLLDDDVSSGEQQRSRIEDLLIDQLPGDHPVVEALSSRLRWSSGASLSPGPLRLDGFSRAKTDNPIAVPASQRGPEGLASPEPRWWRLFAEVRERLLALPAYDEGAVDLSAGALIVLPTDDGPGRVPAFQFEGSPHRVRPVVLETNGLLAVDDDPWGATSWWVDPHALLGDPPVALLGGDNEDWLPALAARLGED